MSLWKSTTIALLLSVTAQPTFSADVSKRASAQGKILTGADVESRLQKIETRGLRDDITLLNRNLPELVTLFHKAQTEDVVHTLADHMIELLRVNEDRIQAELAAQRKEELAAYSQRAYARGYEYLRLHLYNPGATRGVGAKNAYETSLFATTIKEYETLLRKLHVLMSRVEQIRDVKVVLGLNFAKDQNYLTLLVELDHAAEDFERSFGAESSYSQSHLAGKSMLALDINRQDLSFCPDHLLVGKKITTFLPHFDMVNWSLSAASVDMGTGRSKNAMATIRLQGRLWNVYAGGRDSQTRSAAPYWDNMRGEYVQPELPPTLTLLPRANLKSRICEYKFEATEMDQSHAMGYYGGHPPREIPTYSIVFVPAAENQMEPRDRSNDEVQDQLRQEIEGEGLRVSDVNNPHESRRAVSEEMDQRLGRRRSDEHYIREGYLMPSHIQAQTYGRVSLPNYRYNRAYGRMYAIEPARMATAKEIEEAKENRERRELHRSREDERTRMRQAYTPGTRRAYEPGQGRSSVYQSADE